MSLFLGKIHYWLFNKILWFENLEEEIIKTAKSEGLDIEGVKSEIEAKYGAKLENKNLEEIIDTNNIHGWLQDRIKEVESRSAYIITKYYDMYKEESRDLTESAYISQAIKCAQNENNKSDSPENAYISLNNYILSGMPCDRANSVTEKNEDYIIYEQNGCIHRKNYENGQGNLEYLYELRDLWVKTFMESLNTKYLYEKEKLDDKTINKIRKA